MDGTVLHPTESGISAKEIREQLERILDSDTFDASERNRRFLRYIVEERLAGRSSKIKAYCIAVSVFNREPSFDPQTDPIVRLEAGRLRRSLDHYYLAAGQHDQIRISIPKGGYVPHVERLWPMEAPTQPAKRLQWRYPTLVAVLAGAFFVSAAGILEGIAAKSGGDEEALALGRVSVPAAKLGRGLNILVAPFTFQGTNIDRTGAADSLTDNILWALSAHAEVIPYKITSHAKPLPDSPVPLDARLDGGVQWDGDRLRVTAHLTDVVTGSVLWSDQFDRIVTNDGMMRVQQAVGDAIVARVTDPQGTLYQAAALRLRGKRADNLSGLDCALLAAVYQRERSVVEHATVRSCLERVAATLKKPELWSALSTVYADEHRFGFNPRGDHSDSLDRALTAALRASELAPDDMTARRALMTAYGLRGQYDLCLAIARDLTRSAPDDPMVLAEVGMWEIAAGRPEDGMAHVEQALDRDPTQAGPLLAIYYLTRLRTGGLDEALDRTRDLERLNAADRHAALAVAYTEAGHPEEARAEAQRTLAANPDFTRRASEYRSRPLPPAMQAVVDNGLRQAGLTPSNPR